MISHPVQAIFTCFMLMVAAHHTSAISFVADADMTGINTTSNTTAVNMIGTINSNNWESLPKQIFYKE